MFLTESWRLAKRRRKEGVLNENRLLLRNCTVIDVRNGCCMPKKQDVEIHKGRIVQILPSQEDDVSETNSLNDSISKGSQLVQVNCSGLYLCPGLCDAHVHCTAVSADLAGLLSLPESLVTARASKILQDMLGRGFTTIRDAGGADFGLAQAVEEGTILGPRILFTGHALSQTGGHGDFRGKGEDCCACGAALRGIGRVCDGIPEVRKAARDELRKGAHCIKIMASGGVSSPTDRLTNTQFAEDEIRAIVEEAAACGTYVCAHAYTTEAITRAVKCGVRSIEHGNYLDEECASIMAQNGTFLVPTLVTYFRLQKNGEAAGMPAELVAKVGDLVAKGLDSLDYAKEKGVIMCFGSDLLGDLHRYQSEEFSLLSQRLSAEEILQQATINCAKLFQFPEIGEVKDGYIADLLLLKENPLQDIQTLNKEETIVSVLKDGLFSKAMLMEKFGNLNEKLFQTDSQLVS